MVPCDGQMSCPWCIPVFLGSSMTLTTIKQFLKMNEGTKTNEFTKLARKRIVNGIQLLTSVLPKKIIGVQVKQKKDRSCSEYGNNEQTWGETITSCVWSKWFWHTHVVYYGKEDQLCGADCTTEVGIWRDSDNEKTTRFQDLVHGCKVKWHDSLLELSKKIRHSFSVAINPEPSHTKRQFNQSTKHYEFD